MGKEVLLDKSAEKELSKFPRPVGLRFRALFETLEETGKLEEPFAKKLVGQEGLFELRVSHRGQWRVMYAYLSQNSVIILSAFAKKSQQTPKNEILKARKRLFLHLEVI